MYLHGAQREHQRRELLVERRRAEARQQPLGQPVGTRRHVPVQLPLELADGVGHVGPSRLLGHAHPAPARRLREVVAHRPGPLLHVEADLRQHLEPDLVGPQLQVLVLAPGLEGAADEARGRGEHLAPRERAVVTPGVARRHELGVPAACLLRRAALAEELLDGRDGLVLVERHDGQRRRVAEEEARATNPAVRHSSRCECIVQGAVESAVMSSAPSSVSFTSNVPSSASSCRMGRQGCGHVDGGRIDECEYKECV